MKKLLLGAILLFSILSCSSDNEINELPTSNVVRENKNANYKRLIYSVSRNSDPAYANRKDSTVYFYDNENKVIKEIEYYLTIRPNNNGVMAIVNEINFSYDSLGRINKYISSNKNTTDGVLTSQGAIDTYKVRYDERGNMIVNEYDKYDSNDNIIFADAIWDSNNNIVTHSNTDRRWTYVYDDKQNWKNAIYSTVYNKYNRIGENNQLEKFADGVSDSKSIYEYNSQGFPTKITTKQKVDNYPTIQILVYAN